MNEQPIQVGSEGSFTVFTAIATALVKAQSEYGPALKSSENPHYKSRYADLASCIDAVVGSLNKNGIALMQRVLPCSSGVAVETIFIHTSGETISSGPLHVPVQKNDAQGYGSALTYARRYSLMSACGIAPEDDDGNAATNQWPTVSANKPQPKPQPRNDKPTPAVAPKQISDEDDRIPF
jgi:hypothetical protein